jgi:multimeric flavodoxin WrbA
MPSPTLGKDEFERRFRKQFQDPAFEALAEELDRLASVAWDVYREGRKSPRTRKAGPGFADPDFDLSVEWLAAREAVQEAQRRHEDAGGPSRFLLVNGSSRSEHTCPGETSKSWRLVERAHEVLAADPDASVEVIDLARLASEYGRRIHPCKACFSTAAPLCHWPCSCYPNHALGQTQDWMNELYPLWVAAHGILIVTPVNWYAPSSPLKSMIDRLVCADGGNPDPTRTGGKDPARAKAIELAGWEYPRHLEGRLFAIVVHGDVEGAEGVRRMLHDWLSFMRLEPAGDQAELSRYVGYFEPYATSHEALDRDLAVQEEVRNAARTLLEAVRLKRAGRWASARATREPPRQK